MEETCHKPKSGRPRTKTTPENIALVSQLLQDHSNLRMRQICKSTGLKMTVVVRIMKKELKLKRKVANLIPTELTQAQKDNRKEVSQSNIDLLCSGDVDPEDFVQSVVTGDETWISTKEPESRFESSIWLPPNAPHPKKACRIPGSKKTMMTLFCDAKGVILIDFLQPKETVTSERYCQTLTCLKKAIRRKRPKLWAGRQFWLHHDNASKHFPRWAVHPQRDSRKCILKSLSVYL